jgi:hypothetical protein
MQDGLVAGTLGIPAGRAGRHASGRGLEVVRYIDESAGVVAGLSHFNFLWLSVVERVFAR